MILNNVQEEIKAIFKSWPIWFMLGVQDIQLRYRRSSIGPFWISISMAVTICSMGFLYGHLFKITLQNYFPFLASGIIAWSFISTLILESSNAFIEAENYIRNQETFLSLFIVRLILRNLIVFAHNLIVFIPLLFIFKMRLSFNLLLLIPGLLIIMINTIFWGNLLAIIGTRFRDFAQIISSLVQVVFFVTPVMWMPNLLPNHLQWVVTYNPFGQLLNLIRFPLLNNQIEISTLCVVGTLTLLGAILYLFFLNKYKSRIVFWL